MIVELHDPGMLSTNIEIPDIRDALWILTLAGGTYTEAVGKGFAAWRPLTGTWRLGTLCGAVRESMVKLGFKDPGPMDSRALRDLHESGLSVEDIAGRLGRLFEVCSGTSTSKNELPNR